MPAFQGYIENGKVIPIGMPHMPDGFRVIITAPDNAPSTTGAENQSLTRAEIDSMLENSVTRSLLGAIHHANISLEEIRTERLSKYERAD
ncbi:MAG: hypothetical protein LBL05_03635 [Synergistaceae bacterium]|nr:hypothetical protein [Synergistaceae bacterium]